MKTAAVALPTGPDALAPREIAARRVLVALVYHVIYLRPGRDTP